MKRSRRRGSPILRKRLSRVSSGMLRMRSRNMAEKLISATPSNSPSSNHFAPQSHARSQPGIGGYQSRLGKRVIEILADQRRLEDRLSVMHEGRHDAFGIELQIFRSVLLGSK